MSDTKSEVTLQKREMVIVVLDPGTQNYCVPVEEMTERKRRDLNLLIPKEIGNGPPSEDEIDASCVQSEIDHKWLIYQIKSNYKIPPDQQVVEFLNLTEEKSQESQD